MKDAMINILLTEHVNLLRRLQPGDGGNPQTRCQGQICSRQSRTVHLWGQRNGAIFMAH
jgi:hypothetical protein